MDELQFEDPNVIFFQQSLGRAEQSFDTANISFSEKNLMKHRKGFYDTKAQ